MANGVNIGGNRDFNIHRLNMTAEDRALLSSKLKQIRTSGGSAPVDFQTPIPTYRGDSIAVNAEGSSELDMLRMEVGSRLAYGNFVQFSEANFRHMSETGEMTVNAETQAQMRDDFNARTTSILYELLQSAEKGTTRHSLIEQWLTALRDGGSFNLFDMQG